VVGKQWMWKLQHPTGQRELNELHVPVNRPVRLTMTSEDVIHSFYVPAFRIKADVVPGKYTSTWFEATKTGEYHLFCAEYCGTSHAVMGGRIVVMEPAEYERWLTGGASAESLPAAGEALFARLACNTCHKSDGSGRGPSLVGKFGKTEKLASGETVAVDESYVRESILNPQAKITTGYPPIMPTFKGLVTEDQLLQLIAYIKSLKTDGQAKP
jgi:cytochrome c oxidase subunit 2